MSTPTKRWFVLVGILSRVSFTTKGLTMVKEVRTTLISPPLAVTVTTMLFRISPSFISEEQAPPVQARPMPMVDFLEVQIMVTK